MDPQRVVGRSLRQVAEAYISSHPAQKTSKKTVSNASFTPAKKTTTTVSTAILNTETRVAVKEIVPMEHSVLVNVVRRPLSPDARIEVPATWAEYEYVQEHLDNEGSLGSLDCGTTAQAKLLPSSPLQLHCIQTWWAS
ncbi:hypothetical protein LIPSTDRAFT_69583 [Lipomyces starkeyi NRRL Y-11557]|uniref:Uncharacterized protein n=1 Tax=Lipomyces starkeyi NRRL Y-11557 TaxID=675824 RepID=A0A1E3Q8K9_LIPST|nr:hypothetical protein LIPSTDRAFT_69583 [Lipomyces starkeyi NRRL Y-11557]